MTLEKQWNKLTPEEKFQERARQWKFPEGLQFASPDVEHAYQNRVQMILDAVQLRKPERIPVCPSAGFYPFAYAGVTAQEAMYDYGRLGYALKKYHTDFMPDVRASSLLYGPGKAFEILDYKLYRWPGHGLPPTSHFQCVEDEYMRADEYDLLYNDPTDFFLRRYLPRIFATLGPWQMLDTFTDIQELPYTGPSLAAFGSPQMEEACKRLLEAGRVARDWLQTCIGIDRATVANLGLPGFSGGFTKAPFDTIGDTLRGTRAIMLDKFRQPKKLQAAVERLVPIAIDCAVRSAAKGRNPLVFIPLHKGADAFMSNADFKTFYWPTLKAVILGMIQEGLVPFLFVEGSYDKRLDIVADHDIPAGKTLWTFDRTDLREVKKRFAGWACIGGNVPVSILTAAGPEDVKTHVQRLIDDVGRDGGYILSTSAPMYDAKPENLHALIETGKKYGA
ncbi:MAG: uroporphyrinogen decarboxylase family protein [Candidatus Acidiferrales bacterium]